MNSQRDILQDAWILCEGGWIAAMGIGEPPEDMLRRPDLIKISGRGQIALPGFVNTHHHMYQNLARAYSPVANFGLLPWLAGHNPLWKNLTSHDLFVAVQVALAELMLSGCTTTTDHHYVFPQGVTGLIDAEFEAARLMGMRFVACRGSMDVAHPGVTPEVLVQSIEAIMNDTDRLRIRWHDEKRGSMNRLALAPCSLFSVTRDLLRETASYSERHDLRLHIHCGETREEDEISLSTFGKRPIDYLESLGWNHERIWLAHGIHFSDSEVAHLNRNRIGVAHCPCSNMRLGSGVCRVNDLRRGGSPVSLGVDGSASNDSGHMLNEVRQALLLTRVIHGPDAMTVEQALEMATLDGARNLGFAEEIGALAVGMCADIALFPESDLFSNGAENKVDSLVLCHARQVQTLIIHGVIRVEQGELLGINLPKLLEEHEQIARRLHSSVH